jgi:hypothetical protein
MDKTNVVVKLDIDNQSEFLSLLQSESREEDIMLSRVSTWRSSESTLTDIILTLVSAGSLTALATVVKAYLDRTRGKIEIISERNGLKATFDGPLDRLPLVELRNLLESPALSENKSHLEDETTSLPEADTTLAMPPMSQDNTQPSLPTDQSMMEITTDTNSQEYSEESVQPEIGKVNAGKSDASKEAGSQSVESDKTLLSGDGLQDATKT